MEGEAPLSKNQQKRLRKQEAWAATVALRKQQRKEKKVKQREARKAQPPAPSPPLLIKTDRTEWLRRQTSSMGLVIDCDFYPLLTDKERHSLKQQLMYSYSSVRRCSQPCRFYLTGLPTPLLEALTQVSQGNWEAELETASFSERFRKEDLVYLTADAEKTLEDFDETKTYVIGGLVDHNRLKRATVTKANELQIECAKLPIAEHLELTTTKVLAVNHVVGIIMKYRETKDWAQSLVSVLPTRKKAKVKSPSASPTPPSSPPS